MTWSTDTDGADGSLVVLTATAKVVREGTGTIDGSRCSG
jgi:hypothetical protein